LERDFRSPSALAADGLVHLALTATAATTTISAAGVSTTTAAGAAAGRALCFTRSAAIGATVGFVLESLSGEKLLLSGAKGKLGVAIRASQTFISVHT
jgi:hypothetical protein